MLLFAGLERGSQINEGFERRGGVCGTFKSDLSSSTQCEPPKARAKHEHLFNEVASEEVDKFYWQIVTSKTNLT